MYPWSLPSPQAYFKRVAALNAKYMPADPWVDVWEGGCPTAPGVPAGKVGENPCMPMYEAFEKAAQIGGFSQWCSGPWCLQITAAVVLPEPVPFKGRLGMYDVQPAASYASLVVRSCAK